YCSAMTTRLLVGMLTPAIRATALLLKPTSGWPICSMPVPGDKRIHDALAHFEGPGIVPNSLQLGAGYLRVPPVIVNLCTRFSSIISGPCGPFYPCWR